MTDAGLIASGYRRCSGPGPWTNADCFFQRCVRSEDRSAKLYFVNVGMWDFSRFGHDRIVGWEVQAHFYRGSDRSFQLHVPIEESDSVADFEGVLAEFYAAMGCVPDIHNQD